MTFRKFAFIFVLLSSFLADKPVLLASRKSFCLLSIPKSGTHLAIRLISNITCSSPSRSLYRHTFSEGVVITDAQMRRGFKELNTYPFAHLTCTIPFLNYFDYAPECVCILQIRDLRDVCVSMVYWAWDEIHDALGKEPTFDEALFYVIRGDENSFKDTVMNIAPQAAYTVSLLHHPQVIVSRYEELVGIKGGGDDEKQRLLVRNIADRIGVKLGERKLNKVCSGLWGKTQDFTGRTFREGKIGSWNTHFKDEHKEAFKKHMGIYLIQLGYEADDNW